MLREQGVAGSNPAAPTNYNKGLAVSQLVRHPETHPNTAHGPSPTFLFSSRFLKSRLRTSRLIRVRRRCRRPTCGMSSHLSVSRPIAWLFSFPHKVCRPAHCITDEHLLCLLGHLVRHQEPSTLAILTDTLVTELASTFDGNRHRRDIMHFFRPVIGAPTACLSLQPFQHIRHLTFHHVWLP